MIIKKKSLLVAFVSSAIIGGVLVLTLIGYLAYLELKDNEQRLIYSQLLQKINAKVYAKHIQFADLNARVESGGILKGNPVIEGTIKNAGYKPISDMLIKVKLLDSDGAVLYEVMLRPHEPSLGSSSLTQVAIPYLTLPAKTIIEPSGSIAFKKILTNCPKEILSSLRIGPGKAKSPARWSGRLEAEVLSINF